MPLIKLETIIKAPVQLCFDLARDVDVHMASTARTGERAIAGITSGLMKLGDEVTWEAKHLGVRQRFTSKIVAFDSPRTFTDEMQRGAFKRFRHTHFFEPAQEGGTRMIDELNFASPLGQLGRAVDALFLKNYLTRFLKAHNAYIKKLAESRSSSTSITATEVSVLHSGQSRLLKPGGSSRLSTRPA
ncbi:MAG TPA: SRPBCC family protein [Pyrinomonadaceae bacterium]|jgi:ligand-binding SRPBCC domain-containing protein|nr:SRPBCC family protein [Pyrinomonadaceae bacterium]